MDAWNQSTHGKSGLIEKVKNSSTTEEVATHQIVEFISNFVGKNRSPMCGNSICQDRRFLANYMPDLESYFHYRNLDVSVFKELTKRWKPELIDGFKIKIPKKLPSMSSMLVGYFSYDIIRYIEKIPDNCIDDLHIPSDYLDQKIW